jgi:hypothetical protein
LCGERLPINSYSMIHVLELVGKWYKRQFTKLKSPA